MSEEVPHVADTETEAAGGGAASMPQSHVDACFDTNIVLELSTLVDLDRAATANALLAPSVIKLRRDRARASLSAAWLCQKRELTTFSLRHEVEEMLKELAPARSIAGAFPWFFTWFLKDDVLAQWNFATSEAPETSDYGMGGNARDRQLVALAARFGAPLVTHEVKADGTIARAAAKFGVRVITPERWIESEGETVDGLAVQLLERVRERMLVFICERGAFDRRMVDNGYAYVQVMELILNSSQQPDLPDPLAGWGPRLFLRS